MTFIAAFYTFTIELNHADRGIFTSFRIKVARHELESREHLYARLIAYAHAYREELTLNNDPSRSNDPAIYLRNALGETEIWIEVGLPDRKKLELSLKHSPAAEHAIYLYRAEDIADFCHYLRGSKSNWVEGVQFYSLDPALLERLIESESSSPTWNISFIDNAIFLTVTGATNKGRLIPQVIDLESTIKPLDIWLEFQNTLAAESAEAR
jgi:uncharacterized protein YaeQ